MAHSPRIPAIVGPFTFAYPHLTSPDTEGKFADNKYKVDGVGDPNSAPMKECKAIVAAAVKTLGLGKGANLPLKAETEKKEGATKKTPTGNHIFRTKSKFAPVIVDSKGNPLSKNVLAKLKIGAGSVGLIEGYFQSYEISEKIKDADGNIEEVMTPGVSFTMTGIQLISVAAGGGSATFKAYEGGGWTPDADSAEGADLDDEISADDDDAAPADDDGGLDI